MLTRRASEEKPQTSLARRVNFPRHLGIWDRLLVIDDWTTFLATYPAVANDPLFLPYLCFFLRREGVTTLIIDTQSGNPSHLLREDKNLELRTLAQYHLYTWHVPF